MITVASLTALAKYGWRTSDRTLGRGARLLTASHPRYESEISAVYNERERAAKWVEVSSDGPATRHETLRDAVSKVYQNQRQIYMTAPTCDDGAVVDALCGAEVLA